MIGISIEEVDIVVISHGHYDHGGGRKTFVEANSKDSIYQQREAFNGHYSRQPDGTMKYKGLDPSLLPNERFVFVEDGHVIDEGLDLYSEIRRIRYNPAGNREMMMAVGEALNNDNFTHEQNLFITENGESVLLTGCSHSGIVNIMDQVKLQNDRQISNVIGGFHLDSRSPEKREYPSVVRGIGECLMMMDAKYYTCHCTGIEPFRILKEVMGERIAYMETGSKLIL